jgi:hypothetical protein
MFVDFVTKSNLRLFSRGMGGRLDLPESYFRPDERGCIGFTECILPCSMLSKLLHHDLRNAGGDFYLQPRM